MLSGQHCRILLTGSIPDEFTAFWNTSFHMQYPYLMNSEMQPVLQFKLTCLLTFGPPVTVPSDHSGRNCIPGCAGWKGMSLQTPHFLQGSGMAGNPASFSREDFKHKHCIRHCLHSEVKEEGKK